MVQTLIGKVLLNQFRVDSFIASGGMGEVYKVWDLHRNAYLAMKVLRADPGDDPAMLHKLEREAQAMEKLAHPNIVPFYGLYKSKETVFLLEAFISGVTLKEILHQQHGKPLPFSTAMSILKAVAAALGYAHTNGIIHCDVKPGNIMIDSGGSVYLTDFGIARHADSAATFGSSGTPAYMAPEQILGKKVSPATDVYTLGLVLYEMLTGQRPFKGNANPNEGALAQSNSLYAAQLSQAAPDPKRLNREIPEGLTDVLLKALAKDPAQRFTTTLGLLKGAAGASGIAVESISDRANAQIPVILSPAASSQPDQATRDATETPSSATVKHPLRLARFALLGVAVLAVISLTVLPSLVTWIGKAKPPGDIGSAVSFSPIPELASGTPAKSTFPNPTEIAAPMLTDLAFQLTSVSTPTSAPASRKVSQKDGTLLLYVPAGEFSMGASDTDLFAGNEEKPQKMVYLGAFWIDQTEVTNHMFTQFVIETGYKTTAEQRGKSQTWEGQNWTPTVGADWMHPDGPGSSIDGKGNYPVGQVSWFDAKAYCAWAGRRLPTEAEWEKAARGADGRLYPWGNEPPDGSRANFADKSFTGSWGNKSADDGNTFAAPVGSYPAGASPYGALDMAGNMWEWVSNWYSETYLSEMPDHNPPGASSGDEKMIRGGGWGSRPQYLRVSNKDADPDFIGSTGNGFRCAIDE